MLESMHRDTAVSSSHLGDDVEVAPQTKGTSKGYYVQCLVPGVHWFRCARARSWSYLTLPSMKREFERSMPFSVHVSRYLPYVGSCSRQALTSTMLRHCYCIHRRQLMRIIDSPYGRKAIIVLLCIVYWRDSVLPLCDHSP